MLQLVGGAEQEGCGLAVAGDELPHRRDLRPVQLVVEQRRLLQPLHRALPIDQGAVQQPHRGHPVQVLGLGRKLLECWISSF